MFLVHNERKKLTATWFNALATALIAAGLFAPFAALFYGLTELRVGFPSVAVVVVACLAGGTVLHIFGRMVLRRLRE